MSAAPWIACKGAFIQESLHGKPLKASLWDLNGRIRVRRYAGELCLPECVIKRHRSYGFGVRFCIMDDPICYELRVISVATVNSDRKDTFGDRLISRFGPVNWPPRSCDLTPLDYFLWGYVKSLVYADKPQTLDHLEDNVRRVIADTRPQMLEKAIENWTSRLDYIRASSGNPMPEIIFKM
ncbi:transposase [Trichonephila clavipes]|uniref:Transposase n=1 Tax=Trichonephila clavipes TaxID=2585209 RepID=A0A8X6S3W5_TRICX|nr:transposase [Trichonephila clavipes]